MLLICYSWEVLVYLSGMRNLAQFLPCPSWGCYSSPSVSLLQVRFKKGEFLIAARYMPPGYIAKPHLLDLQALLVHEA